MRNIMRASIVAFLALVVLSALCVSSRTEAAAPSPPSRVALLIGNKNYTARVGPLRNPLNDIKLVGRALSDVGFDSNALENASREQILEQTYELADKLRAAGPGAIGFFYYSGHGFAIDKHNVLAPVDVTDSSDRTLTIHGVKLDEIIEILLRVAPSATHFVVVDACRSNLRGQRGGKGFVPEVERDRVVVWFATKANEVASDEGDEGGPFAVALAAAIVKPGKTHEEVFSEVRDSVFSRTLTNQMPWPYDGVIQPKVIFKVPQPVRKEGGVALKANEAEQITGDWPLVVIDVEKKALLYYGFMTISVVNGQVSVVGRDWLSNGEFAHPFESQQSRYENGKLEYWYKQGEGGVMRGYTTIHFFPAGGSAERHAGKFLDERHLNVRFYARKLPSGFPPVKRWSAQLELAKEYWEEFATELPGALAHNLDVDWQ